MMHREARDEFERRVMAVVIAGLVTAASCVWLVASCGEAQAAPTPPSGVDKCTNKDCVAKTFKAGLTTGLACNAAREGQLARDAGYRECLAGTWQPLGLADSTQLTGTAPIVVYDDGGTVNVSVGITQYSATIDVGSVSELNCLVTSVNSIPGVVLEAGDACDVGFALSSLGGAAQTTWDCWPSDVNAARLRTCCVAGVGGGACDPASQTLYLTFTCPDGSCQ